MKDLDDNKNVAIVIAAKDPSGNPRPLRMIQYLREKNYAVDVASYSFGRPLDIRNFYEINKPALDIFSRLKRLIVLIMHRIIQLVFRSGLLKDRMLLKRYQLNGLVKKIRNTYNLIIVEDLHLLPLAFTFKKEAKVIFDAREFYTKQNDELLRFKLLEKSERERLCNTYLPICDEVLTVSPGLQRAYLEEFNITTKLLRSTPYFYKNSRFNKLFKSESDSFKTIKIVHHGIANRNRQIDKMIDVVEKLDNRFIFDLYLTGKQSYINELKKKTDSLLNINIKDPVNFDDIIPTISNYDIGFFYVEPTTFNLKHCLPNKFFEFIQARLMIAIGPSPDMANLVNKYNCGVISEEFTVKSMVEKLNNLTFEQVMLYRKNADIAANDLCFENEKKVMDLILSSEETNDS